MVADVALSPGHFFHGPWRHKKSAQSGGVLVGQKPRRGSLQRLAKVGLLHAHGAETCPLSAITKPFSPLPKKCPGEVAVQVATETA